MSPTTTSTSTTTTSTSSTTTSSSTTTTPDVLNLKHIDVDNPRLQFVTSAVEPSDSPDDTANALWDDENVDWDDPLVDWDGGPIYESSDEKPSFRVRP